MLLHGILWYPTSSAAECPQDRTCPQSAAQGLQQTCCGCSTPGRLLLAAHGGQYTHTRQNAHLQMWCMCCVGMLVLLHWVTHRAHDWTAQSRGVCVLGSGSCCCSDRYQRDEGRLLLLLLLRALARFVWGQGRAGCVCTAAGQQRCESRSGGASTC